MGRTRTYIKCGVCRGEKPRDSWRVCQPCRTTPGFRAEKAAYMAQYRAERPEMVREALEAARTPERREVRAAQMREWRALPENRAKGTKRVAEARLEALAHYGGKCAICGEARQEALSFDHVEGGGGRHRQETKMGNMGPWLKSLGFPPADQIPGYRGSIQVLCLNCNQTRPRPWVTKRPPTTPHLDS
jgi:hypothetical protein